MVAVRLLAILLAGLPATVLRATEGPATTNAATSRPTGPVIGECLVIGPFARTGAGGPSRQVGGTADPVGAQLIHGRFAAPRDGETITAVDGRSFTWRRIEATESVYSDDSLAAGGWAYLPVDSPDERVVMLAASGHAVAFVNGEPRAGDPYETGFVRLPVQLRKGRNDLLFTGGRGRLRVELAELRAAVFIDPADATTPDFLEGESDRLPLSVVVVNSTTQPVNVQPRVTTGKEVSGRASGGSGARTTSIPPLTVRKVAVPVHYSGERESKLDATVQLLAADGTTLDSAPFVLRTRKPGQTYKRTFVSGIDGSVQYFSIVPTTNPAAPAATTSTVQVRPATLDRTRPALVLSLHGASVEATSQADAYAGKSWTYIVCPTNRRPFGFDWEDWGRLDAIEVLDRAQTLLETDPTRAYLTGHSMGGHGSWQLGSIFPDRFAAVAPSAGWLSFASYARREPATAATATAPTTAISGKPNDRATVTDMFRRAGASSDTEQLMPNLSARGVYILHGVDDDNVPVREARAAVEILRGFHRDFSLFEQPRAGHWWDISPDEPGADCVDWAPIFDLFARRRLPRAEEVRELEFRTVNPAVSSSLHWATIDAQQRPMEVSSVRLRFDPHSARVSGSTENVAKLRLDVGELTAGGSMRVELDASKSPGTVALPDGAGGQSRAVWLERVGDTWVVVPARPAAAKSARRSGPFKMAFTNRMVLVYGTGGSAEMRRATLAKARYDAETWWYRGNGAVDVVDDARFDAHDFAGRNVILYGNAETNQAWGKVLDPSALPIEIRPGKIRVGERELVGEDLATLLVYPRAGDPSALVGVIGATGPAGMRLAARLPIFVSGIGYPDWCIVGPEMLSRGLRSGARGAGFFSNDWKLSAVETAWSESPEDATAPSR